MAGSDATPDPREMHMDELKSRIITHSPYCKCGLCREYQRRTWGTDNENEQ